MRSRIYIKILFFTILLINCKGKEIKAPTNSSNIPLNNEQQVVVDNSNLFSSIERNTLTKKIIKYEENTTNEIAILTLDSLITHTDIQAFGALVANSWEVGKKEKDNGLLITISKFDRKVAINTGIGTKKTISDYECKIIIDSVMIPSFKKKEYYNGVNKALDSIFLLWD